MQSKVSLWQAYRFACIAILHNLPIFVPLFLLFALISVLLLALFYHVPALFSVVPTKSIFISNDQIDYATFLQENLGFSSHVDQIFDSFFGPEHHYYAVL